MDTSLKPRVATIELPRYTVSALLRLFRRILMQPNVQSVRFEAGEPVHVTYHANPLEESLETRLLHDLTVDELMTRISIVPVEVANPAEAILKTLNKIYDSNLQPSHCLVANFDVLSKKLGVKAPLTFLGTTTVEWPTLPASMVVIAAGASSVGTFGDVQVMYGVTV